MTDKQLYRLCKKYGARALEARLSELPILHEAMEKGVVSVSKLLRVVSVATIENSEKLLEMTKELSSAALDVKVKEIRNEKALKKSKDVAEVLCAQKKERNNGLIEPNIFPEIMSFQFDQDVQEQLKTIQKQGHDLSTIYVSCYKNELPT